MVCMHRHSGIQVYTYTFTFYIFPLTVFSLSSCSPKQSIRFLTLLFSFSGFFKCPGVENWIPDHIHAHAGLLSSIPNRWLLSQTSCPEVKAMLPCQLATLFKNTKFRKLRLEGQLSSRHAHCSCGGSELDSQHPHHTAQGFWKLFLASRKPVFTHAPPPTHIHKVRIE